MRTIIPAVTRGAHTPRTASRAAVLVVLLAASLLVAAAPSATATTSFQFTGSGWGHGVGMSQYGALEQARDGRTAEQIIAHYYRGAKVARPDLGLGEIYIGLSQDRTNITVVPRGGGMQVVFAGKDHGVVAAGDAARVAMWGSDGRCHLILGGKEVDSAPACSVDFNPRPGARLTLNNENVEYGHGSILFRPREGRPSVFHVVAKLPNLDTYLLGLREVPQSWPTEALRAQAIAGRSYAAYDLLGGGGVDARACGCHLYDSVRSQVYGGTTGLTDAWRRAVSSTEGMVVWAAGADGTEGGGVVQAFYSSSSGGRTEAIEDSSAFRSEPRPYFRSVDDPWSLRASNPYAHWTIDVPESTIRRNLSLDDVLSIAVTARNESGSAREVTFTGTRGGATTKVTTTGDRLRGLLGLRSGYIASVFLPPFTDDDGNTHEADIAWLATQDITRGCNPPQDTRYCPDDAVTRAEMATFLTRALDLRPRSEPFSDVAPDDTHAGSIGAIAARDITRGCNPPRNTRYCPDTAVTRAEMATFLARALDLRPRSESFDDVAPDDTHAGSIGAIAARGITMGCTETRYCPDEPVTRAQMASFIRRAGI